MSGKLLSLDTSTSVGWARLQKGTRPRFGTVHLSGPDLAWKLGQFAVWLDEHYAADPFDAICWERPLLLRTDTVDKLELLFGLTGNCYAFAGRHRMPWREVSVPDVKKALTNRANATKEQMVFAAHRIAGWRVSNDHEADAGAAGLVAYARLFP